MKNLDYILESFYVEEKLQKALNEGILDTLKNLPENASVSTLKSVASKLPDIPYDKIKDAMKLRIKNFDHLHAKHKARVKGDEQHKEVGATILVLVDQLDEKSRITARDILEKITKLIMNTGFWLSTISWFSILMVYMVQLAFLIIELNKIRGVFANIIYSIFIRSEKIYAYSLMGAIAGFIIGMVGSMLHNYFKQDKRKDAPEVKNPYEEYGV